MKNRPYITGIIAFFSPLPIFVFAILWSWIWCFGIGIGLLHYDPIPDWILVVSLLPLLISPALGIIGILHGIVKRKKKLAWLGILLSELSLLENLLLLWGIIYLSRF